MLYRENFSPDGVSYGILLDVLCAKQQRHSANGEQVYVRELKHDLIILDNLTRKNCERQRDQSRNSSKRTYLT